MERIEREEVTKETLLKLYASWAALALPATDPAGNFLAYVTGYLNINLHEMPEIFPWAVVE